MPALIGRMAKKKLDRSVYISTSPPQCLNISIEVIEAHFVQLLQLLCISLLRWSIVGRYSRLATTTEHIEKAAHVCAVATVLTSRHGLEHLLHCRWVLKQRISLGIERIE